MSNAAEPEKPGVDASVSPDSVQAWTALLQQLQATGQGFSRLLQLELRLALGDARRLLLVSLALLPLVFLAWCGFSVLLAWLAFDLSQSVAAGIAAFIGVQLLMLAALQRMIRSCRRSFALPASRRQWQSFMEGIRHGAQKADQ